MKVECECGNKKSMRKSHIVKTKSCGCKGRGIKIKMPANTNIKRHKSMITKWLYRATL